MKALPWLGSDILFWFQGQLKDESKQELRKLIAAKLIPNMFLSNVEFFKMGFKVVGAIHVKILPSRNSI